MALAHSRRRLVLLVGGVIVGWIMLLYVLQRGVFAPMDDGQSSDASGESNSVGAGNARKLEREVRVLRKALRECKKTAAGGSSSGSAGSGSRDAADGWSSGSSPASLDRDADDEPRSGSAAASRSFEQRPSAPPASRSVIRAAEPDDRGDADPGRTDRNRCSAGGPRHTKVLQRTPRMTPECAARAKPQLVLVHGSHFFGNIAGEMPCPVKCVWTDDGSRIRDADAVWFHIPTFGGFPERGHPNQKFVAMSMEGDGYYPRLKDRDFMSQFDLTMTYRLDSDVPVPYPSWAEYNFMEEPWNKTADALAVAVISNCGPNNRRNEWVQELMQYIKVDSYGRCFHNKEFPASAEQNWFQKKIDVLRPYKFYLAFDNTDSWDYVSEKFFHGLVAGSVPVYMGAPNIEDFAPSPHSVISTKHFKNPRELADYLLFLDQHDELYQEYLQWKVDGPSQKFRDLVDINSIHSRCRLCIRLAQDQMGVDNECRPKQ